MKTSSSYKKPYILVIFLDKVRGTVNQRTLLLWHQVQHPGKDFSSDVVTVCSKQNGQKSVTKVCLIHSPQTNIRFLWSDLYQKIIVRYLVSYLNWFLLAAIALKVHKLSTNHREHTYVHTPACYSALVTKSIIKCKDYEC